MKYGAESVKIGAWSVKKIVCFFNISKCVSFCRSFAKHVLGFVASVSFLKVSNQPSHLCSVKKIPSVHPVSANYCADIRTASLLIGELCFLTVGHIVHN